jgi:transcriptional regulator GlxA family with amidase domain
MSFAPISAFETANFVTGDRFYDIHLVSEAGEKVSNSLGKRMDAERLGGSSYDTLVVGATVGVLPPTPDTVAFLRKAITTTRRVEMDRIFIADGPVWTSAGMTAGIDLALGLIERDMGQEVARATARTLVVHHRRAGGQSQHSAMLELDAKSDRIQTALAFARKNLREQLTVEQLAEAARLSPRQFSRIFKAETGQSPARAIQNLRLEAARFMLEQGRLPVGEIARETGFGDWERMRRSFRRTFGQTPQAIRNASRPLTTF